LRPNLSSDSPCVPFMGIPVTGYRVPMSESGQSIGLCSRDWHNRWRGGRGFVLRRERENQLRWIGRKRPCPGYPYFEIDCNGLTWIHGFASLVSWLEMRRQLGLDSTLEQFSFGCRPFDVERMERDRILCPLRGLWSFYIFPIQFTENA